MLAFEIYCLCQPIVNGYDGGPCVRMTHRYADTMSAQSTTTRTLFRVVNNICSIRTRERSLNSLVCFNIEWVRLPIKIFLTISRQWNLLAVRRRRGSKFEYFTIFKYYSNSRQLMYEYVCIQSKKDSAARFFIVFESPERINESIKWHSHFFLHSVWIRTDTDCPGSNQCKKLLP